MDDITKKLDDLQERIGYFLVQRRRGALVNERVFSRLESHYVQHLEKLHSYKAWEELRTYTAWYKRYLNSGDAV